MKSDELPKVQRALLRIIFRNPGGIRYDKVFEQYGFVYHYARRSMSALERRGFIRTAMEVRGEGNGRYVYCTSKGTNHVLGDEWTRKKEQFDIMKLDSGQRKILVALDDSEAGLTYVDIVDATQILLQEAYPIISSLKRRGLVSEVKEFRGGDTVKRTFFYCTPDGRVALAGRKPDGE